MMRLAVLGALAVTGAYGHSSLIYPKPRNAIDSLLPEWSGGKAPYRWEKVAANPLGDYPCQCVNGTEPCESAQTCTPPRQPPPLPHIARPAPHDFLLLP